MRPRPERRSTLKERVDRSKRKLDDRGKHMTKVVKEKKAIADTSRKLRFPTKEGAAEIKTSLKKATEAEQKEFEKQEKDLKKKHGECKEAEGDLLDRTRLAIIDSIHVKKVMWVKEVDKAKSLLAKAEKKLGKDARFTEDLRRRLKRDRERSEKECNTLRKIIRSKITIYGDAS